MKTTILAITLAAITAASLRADPVGTAFTYQGKLNDGGAPATGLYDFVFKLYTGAGPGDPQVASAVPLTAVPVTNGLFTVKLDFGANVFQGDARWLNTEVRTNDNLASYSELSPRQELTPTPYAICAGSAPWSGVSGVPPGFADGVDNNTTYAAGTGLILSSNTFSLDPAATDSVYWKLAGNAGTPAGSFLGTTDNRSLELRVNNQRALWIRPVGAGGVPNLIGGSLYNGTAAGVEGAFIGGGGTSGADNSIYANFGALGGGAQNRIDGVYGFVGGGGTNRILSTAPYGVLTGGQGNTLGGDHGVVSGGWGNVNQTTYGTIGGGANHLLQAPYSATIAGGYQNTVYGQDATIGGGSYNTGQADYSIIAGGQFNYVGTNIHDLGEFGLITNYASYSALLGGAYHRISSIYSSVGGGANNLVYGDYSQIGGGSGNQVGNPSTYSSAFAYNTIAGGLQNRANGLGATVAGGGGNTASGLWSSVLGGHFNTATGEVSVAMGQQAVGRLFGQLAHSAGRFAADGDAQSSEYVLRRTTIGGDPGVLFLDGSSSRLTIPVGATLQFDIQVTARNAAGDSAGFRINGVIKNVAGTTSFVGSPTTDHTWRDSGASIWAASVTADDLGDTLQVGVSSELASDPIRWVATVRTTEVSF